MILRHQTLRHGTPAPQPLRVRATTTTTEIRRPSLLAARPPSLVGGVSASASSSLARQRPRARRSTAVTTQAAAAAQSEGRGGASAASASASASAAAAGQGASAPLPPSAPSAAASWRTLRDYSAAEFRKQARAWVDTPEKRADLRDALMTAYRLPAPPESGYGWLGAGGGGGGGDGRATAADSAAADAEAAAGAQLNAPKQPDVIVGIVASDARMAVRALRDWCAALGLPYVPPDVRLGGRDAPPPPNPPAAAAAAAASDAAAGGGGGGASTMLASLPPGPVYVKYAPVGRLCFASPYSGPDRGVLLQLGQAPLLGHFPLGLHDRVGAAPS